MQRYRRGGKSMMHVLPIETRVTAFSWSRKWLFPSASNLSDLTEFVLSENIPIVLRSCSARCAPIRDVGTSRRHSVSFCGRIFDWGQNLAATVEEAPRTVRHPLTREWVLGIWLLLRCS
jgi:hypothetical protein